jgi:hypothetical protein
MAMTEHYSHAEVIDFTEAQKAMAAALASVPEEKAK